MNWGDLDIVGNSRETTLDALLGTPLRTSDGTAVGVTEEGTVEVPVAVVLAVGDAPSINEGKKEGVDVGTREGVAEEGQAVGTCVAAVTGDWLLGTALVGTTVETLLAGSREGTLEG